MTRAERLFHRNLATEKRMKPREIAFASGLPGETGRLLVNLLSEDHSRADARGRHHLMLEGYGYRWYRVGGLDYLLKRSDIDLDTAEKAGHAG
jgi:maltose alpha-D-glucosyltransferase/alpha-amylase